jgi:hypothetical protein
MKTEMRLLNGLKKLVLRCGGGVDVAAAIQARCEE